jgi:hypothetical protein
LNPKLPKNFRQKINQLFLKIILKYGERKTFSILDCFWILQEELRLSVSSGVN